MKEYIRNNQMKNHQMGQDNTLKKKKPLTYNEIKKTIDSMSDFNKSEMKQLSQSESYYGRSPKQQEEKSNPATKAKPKGKKSVGKMMKKYNFDIV